MTAAVEVAPEVKVAPVSDGVTYIKEVDVAKVLITYTGHAQLT
jgi:hypothetical protein